MYYKKLCRLTIFRNIVCLTLGGLLLLIGITEARYAYRHDSQGDNLVKRLALYGIFLKSNRP
ncbi:MAG: hypothetical protein HC812_16640 [Leptolyngbya sp. RL_3_1]|nr:hypothetical protein [Leptolyngbya sp. RL_3_1]